MVIKDLSICGAGELSWGHGKRLNPCSISLIEQLLDLFRLQYSLTVGNSIYLKNRKNQNDQEKLLIFIVMIAQVIKSINNVKG